VFTSVAFTMTLAMTDPVASLMMPVIALLVPLCAHKVSVLTAVNRSRIASFFAFRFRTDKDLRGLRTISV
jgi:hypothetical protein